MNVPAIPTPSTPVAKATVNRRATVWQRAMNELYINYYQIRVALNQADNYTANQVAALQKLQRQMLMTLSDLHDDLNVTAGAPDSLLGRHTEAVRSLNLRASRLLCGANA